MRSLRQVSTQKERKKRKTSPNQSNRTLEIRSALKSFGDYYSVFFLLLPLFPCAFLAQDRYFDAARQADMSILSAMTCLCALSDTDDLANPLERLSDLPSHCFMGDPSAVPSVNIPCVYGMNGGGAGKSRRSGRRDRDGERKK